MAGRGNAPSTGPPSARAPRRPPLLSAPSASSARLRPPGMPRPAGRGMRARHTASRAGGERRSPAMVGGSKWPDRSIPWRPNSGRWRVGDRRAGGSGGGLARGDSGVARWTVRVSSWYSTWGDRQGTRRRPVGPRYTVAPWMTSRIRLSSRGGGASQTKQRNRSGSHAQNHRLH
jgi:hypothetical protein